MMNSCTAKHMKTHELLYGILYNCLLDDDDADGNVSDLLKSHKKHLYVVVMCNYADSDDDDVFMCYYADADDDAADAADGDDGITGCNAGSLWRPPVLFLLQTPCAP